MADLVKLKTGTISKLEQKDSSGNPVISLDAGSVYFAVDTTNHKGKIVYDAPKSNGVDRIVMSTDAENADHATSASNADKASQAAQLINTRKIDGINFNGTADVSRYAVCATAAGTAAKIVSVSNFNLITGARVSVRFSATNTAANPTLNVSSSGAKPIFYNGSAITAGYLLANKVWDFVYDASLNSSNGAWVLVGEKDTNTTYGEATGSAAGLMSASDKASYDIIKSNYLNGLTTDSANHKLTFTYGVGKVATDRALNFVKLAGDTFNSGAIFSWPDSGNYANKNSGVTFPVDRGGLKWTGQSDGIYLHGVETASDNLDLQLQFTGDNSNGLSIRNNANAEVIRLGANGNLTATGAGTLNGALTVGGTTTLKGALVANGTATIGQTLTVNGATKHNATVTFANGVANVVGDDAQFGDINNSGTFAIQGLNGITNIWLVKQGQSWAKAADHASLTYDGSNLILDKRIKVPSAGSSWITGKTIGNASINITTDISEASYHPLLAVKNYNSHVWNIGGLGNNVGIYGYYAARTANGTDYSTVWNMSSGKLTHSHALEVGGAATLKNTLTVSGATAINNTLTTTGTTALNSMSSFARGSVTSGTAAGTRTSLLIYGTTYGNDATNLAKAGQLSYGDPGPQIVFNTANSLTSGQTLALIYTDHDAIASGVSLSLVSNQTDAWFIAPHIKALSGFSGNLTGNVTGNVSGTSAKWANKLTLKLSGDLSGSINFDGSEGSVILSAQVGDNTHNHSASNITTGVLAVARGGTGQSTLVDAGNAMINALTTGASVPVDKDYFISQYVNGGTNTTTYHRRPMSTLWSYIEGKISSDLGLNKTNYGGTAATAKLANSVDWSNVLNKPGTATQLANGFMSAADKKILDNVASTYVKKAGDTMTGALSFQEGTKTGIGTIKYNSADECIDFVFA